MTLVLSAVQTHEKPRLVRGLGLTSAAAIIVGTMIGTGIFLKPSEVALLGGSVSVALVAWVIGGIVSLFGALCYAELGASIPEAGGEYVYLSRGLGRVWGYAFGWTHCILARPASAAAIAAALLRFCGFLLPGLVAPIWRLPLRIPVVGNVMFTLSWSEPLAIAAIAGITWINYRGVRLAGQVQIGLTAIKVAAVVVLIVGAFGSGKIRHGSWMASTPWGWTSFHSFVAAIAVTLWAYDGWNDLNLVGSEVENPGRVFPQVIVTAVLAVIALFLIFNGSCFFALPFYRVADSPHVASDVLAVGLGHNAALWITLAMAFSALGTLNSSILSGARVDYAMARDGMFFRVAAPIHPVFRTPGNALIVQGCLASIMVLSGSFEDLTSLVMFANWTFYGLAVIAMMRLRRLEPALPRPYRTWGFPAVPVIFAVCAIALSASLWWERPIRSSLGMLAIFSGLIFYRRWRTRIVA